MQFQFAGQTSNVSCGVQGLTVLMSLLVLSRVRRLRLQKVLLMASLRSLFLRL